MSIFLSPTFGAGYQSFTNAGIVNSGGTLTTYVAGSTTPASTYTTSVGNVLNSNPITFNSAGRLANEVWLTGGVSYKFIVQDSVGNILGTYDNVSGINDTTLQSEWISSGVTPTYVSATSFTVPGNQTAIFTNDRRIQASITAGTVYGSVSSTSVSTVTTVNVTLDSGSLDSGLSVVNVSLLNPAHPSVANSGITFLGNNIASPVTGLSGSVIAPIKMTKIANSVVLDIGVITGTSTSSSKFTAFGATFAPSSNKFAPIPISNNGSSTSLGRALIDTGGTVTFYPDMTGTSTWVGTGSVSIGPFQTVYIP